MKQSLFLLLSISIFSFLSCSTCEDETLKVNDKLLNWMPYDSVSSVSFTNQSNQTVTYSITPNVETKTEDNDGCIITIVRPYLVLDNEEVPNFLRLWFMRQQDILSDNDQVWASLSLDGENAGSAVIFEADQPDIIASQVSINGLVFNEVITLDVTKNSSAVMTLYLQENIGILGFKYDGDTWLLN